MLSLSIGLLISLGCVPIGGTPPQAVKQVEGQSATISVLLRAKQTTVKAGDALVVERTITNRSGHVVTIGRDAYHPGCAVEVLDASGNFPADKKAGYRRGRLDLSQLARMSPEEVAKSGLLSGKLVWIKLKPGESLAEKCNISDFYDLTAPGRYRITADYPDPESAVLIRSNTVEVTAQNDGP